MLFNLPRRAGARCLTNLTNLDPDSRTDCKMAPEQFDALALFRGSWKCLHSDRAAGRPHRLPIRRSVKPELTCRLERRAAGKLGCDLVRLETAAAC